jgi:hypothetical protein
MQDSCSSSFELRLLIHYISVHFYIIMRRIEFWTVKNPLNDFKTLVVVAVNLSSSSVRERYAGLTGKIPCMTQPEVLASLSIVGMGQG